MIIKRLDIKEKIQKKIFDKHGVYIEEIEKGLFYGKPIIYRAKCEKYLAITHFHRYITIIFRYDNESAHIITTYPSSKWQIKLYKKKT